MNPHFQTLGCPAARTVVRLGLLISIGISFFSSYAAKSRADGQIRFNDVTAQSRITFKHNSAPEKKYIVESMSGGVALFDYDNDGLLDIYLVNSLTVATASSPKSSRSELWHNNGDGTFSDVTDKSGLGYPGWGMGVCTGDFDNDGWEDVYVTCLGPNRLYRNNGNGTFSDVTGKSMTGDNRWSTGAAFADYDNDGWLDLFVANYVDFKLDNLPEFGKGKMCQYRGVAVQCGPRGLPGAGDALYHNNRDGTFTEVSKAAGVSDPPGHYGLGVAWCDFNGDGLEDFYVANDSRPNYLYKNNGNGTFTEVGFLSGAAVSEDGAEQGSMGVTIGDYDHRGRWHIFVTNFSDEYNALYHQESDFLFTDVSFASQTGQSSFPFVGWGTRFFDYDNDGWLDLMVVNGHVYPQMENAKLGTTYRQRKLFYKNNRNGTFSEIAAQLGSALMEPAVSRGAAFGDLDNDGDVDVVVNNLDGAPVVLRNDGGNSGNFISLRLIGTGAGNRNAFGARVKVTAGDLVQIDENRSGGSYISQNDYRLHFGLEKRTTVDSVEIRWPDGKKETLSKIPANTFVVVKEGSGVVSMKNK
ncbi:MAG TPA: CRTAC1 family protein [Acidobacteriota bacterium]